MITQLQLIIILGAGTVVGLLIFGVLFVIGCIFGQRLDDARQDMDWRGSDAAEDARRGK